MGGHQSLVTAEGTAMLFGGEISLEAGEHCILTMHAHPWPLVRAARPLLLPVLAPGLYALLDAAAPGLRLSAHVALLLWVVGVAAACYLVKWLALDLLPWSRRVYVLTNRHVITQSGVLAVYRRECSLLKIEESDYVMRGLVARLLNFGDVEVRPSGGLGAVVLRGVARPGRVQALISAQARAASDEVAQHHLLDAPDEVVRRLEVIVRGTPPPHSAPTAPLQPVSARAVRTRPAPRVPRLNLLPGEDVVDVTRQHPIVLASGLRAPLLGALVVVLGATVAGPGAIRLAVALVGLVLAPWAIWRLLTYLEHQYVLTTGRLMELRSTPLVFQMRDIVQLSSVQDVVLEIPSRFGRLADVGDVVIKVSGSTHRPVLKTVARPAQLQKLIFETIHTQQRREHEAEDQRLAATLSHWFQEYHRLQQGGGDAI
jgi:uncharacterized membrane protein YdbT with pleckstrin-like domain